MPHIACPQCGHKVEPEHKYCPECGARLPRRRAKKTKSHFSWGCFFFSLLLLGLLGVAGYYGWEWKTQKDMEIDAYRALEGETNVERYNDFIARFPDSKRLEKVRRRMEVLEKEQSDFAALLASGDIHALRRFLIDNPPAEEREAVERTLDTLEYHAAIDAGTLEALQEYIATHVSSPFLSAARSHEKQLQRTTVSPTELSRLRRLAERFAGAMNNGDDTGLSYLLAPSFTHFNGRDTTTTSFVHDIMVYVNERIFHEHEDLLLSVEGDPTAKKRPHGSEGDFVYDFKFTLRLLRSEESGVVDLDMPVHATATATSGGQLVGLTLKF